MKNWLPICLLICSTCLEAQIPEAVFNDRIASVQLHALGNQLGYPVLRLNSGDQLELHFDDLDGGVRNYSYTYQLCNADWTPAMLGSSSK